MNKGDDPYEILGVPYDAAETKIKKAYFKLARIYHPDKQSTEEDKVKNGAIFARVSDAYDLLNDPVRRYDWKSANESKMRNIGSQQPRATTTSTTSPVRSPMSSASRPRPSGPSMTRSTPPPPPPAGYKASPNMSARSTQSPPPQMRNRYSPNAQHRGGPPPPPQQRTAWPSSPNPFDVLGIHWNADRVEVISSYRILAQKYHPSKQRTEESRMHAAKKMGEVSWAYEVLKDPIKLKEWQMRSRGPSSNGATPTMMRRKNPAPRNSNGPLGGSLHNAPRNSNGPLGGSLHNAPRNSNGPLGGSLHSARGRGPKPNLRRSGGKKTTASVIQKLGLPMSSSSNHGKSTTAGPPPKENANVEKIIKEQAEIEKMNKKLEKKEKKKAKKEKKKAKKEKISSLINPTSMIWKREKSEKTMANNASSDHSFGTAQTSETSDTLLDEKEPLIQAP